MQKIYIYTNGFAPKKYSFDLNYFKIIGSKYAFFREKESNFSSLCVTFKKASSLFTKCTQNVGCEVFFY